MKKYALVLVIAVGALAAVMVIKGRAPERAAEPPATSQANPHAGMAMDVAYTGKVVETMNAGGYTYVQLDTGGETVWAAGPETRIEAGVTASIPAGMEMNGFHSETLDRTFDTIFFVSEIRTGDGGGGGAPGMPEGHPPIAAPDPNIDVSGIEPPQGGSSIADVYANKGELTGKEVLVRGKVVKFTPNVMQTNWIHLRDGSGESGDADITVTTSATAAIGDIVVARGVLTADRDFGHGYEYEVLVEDAEVTVEGPSM